MILQSLYIKRTKEKGWGVFTNKTIGAGVIVEVSPVIVMSSTERILLDQTKLYNYIFEWEQQKCCMAMGFVPVYNHASPSNCEYFQVYDDETIFIKTVNRIKAEEELTINYNGDFNNLNGVWFDIFA